MVRMILNDKEIEAPAGESILEVARAHGVDIPTLCYLKALGTYGVCRLCIVEVSGTLPRSIRISCAQAVQEGLVVETESERVRKNRRFIFELLLARSPDAKELIDLAARYGVTDSRFYAGSTGDDCLRCGRCVRACREKIGAFALCFAHRGYDRKVTTDFERLSEYCIGCGACAQVCPTGAIAMEDRNGVRTIRAGKLVVARHQLEPCQGCGTPYAPRKYLDYVLGSSAERPGLEVERGYCARCARSRRGTGLAGHLQSL